MNFRMSKIENPAFRDLVSIGVADPSRMGLFHTCTRDKPIAVHRDREAGFLAFERHEQPEEYNREAHERVETSGTLMAEAWT